MEVTEGRNPVNTGQAIYSLKKMGFTPLSAVCEILDNAIEAKATRIHITIEWKQKQINQRQQRAGKIIFTDNGTGMNKEVLFNTLIMGESTRMKLNKGIGKFGVGATLAGISQGDKIQVYSKIKGGTWYFTELDLDLLKNGIGIREPVEKDPESTYQDGINDNGTIVIWEKINSDFNEKDRDDIVKNIGRIYRKFLTKEKLEDGRLIKNTPIELLLNSKPIPPYDPLYLTYNPKADDTEIPKFTSQEYTIKDKGIKSKMRITFSEFPNSWWINPDDYKPGQTKASKERNITTQNSGISIVREGREMIFGEIPYLKLYTTDPKKSGTAFNPEDRWTGIEVSFNRDADDIFGIEANKSKMQLPYEIRKQIGTILRGPLFARRDYFKKKRGEALKKSGKADVKKPGGRSKNIIQKGIPAPAYSDPDKKKLEEIAKQLVSSPQDFDECYNDLIKGYHPIHSWDLDPRGPFVTFEHHLQSIVVKYNMNHVLVQKLFNVFEDIAVRQGKDPNEALTIEEIQRAKTIFDLMLAAYGLAEQTFSNLDQEEKVYKTLSTIMSRWGEASSRISEQDLKSE